LNNVVNVIADDFRPDVLKQIDVLADLE